MRSTSTVDGGALEDGEPAARATGRPTEAQHGEVVSTILSRSSVRDGFSDRDVPQGVVLTILQCGRAAPSSKGAQPWGLHAITDRQLLRAVAGAALAAEAKSDYVPHSPRTASPRPEYTSSVDASCAVVEAVPLVVAVENRGPFSDGVHAMLDAEPLGRHTALMGYGLEMLGIGGAIQNMWLAAIDLGLQGVMTADLNIAAEEIRSLLHLDGDLVGLLALGWVADGRSEPAADQGLGSAIERPELFVSYSSLDEELAFRFVSALEAQGVRCWAAGRDVTSGGRWDDEVGAALDRCDDHVLILTESSAGSDEVKAEMANITERGRSPFVVRADGVLLPYDLRRILGATQEIALDPEDPDAAAAVIVAALGRSGPTAAP